MTANTEGVGGFFGNNRKSHSGQETSNRSKTKTGGHVDQEPVVVWEAANNMEAQIVKGRLESEGIPAIIRGEALGTIYGLTTGSLAATDILVPAAIAEKAIEILNTEVEWVFEEDDAIDDLDTDEAILIG